jgi:ABC-type antimicrobial peptide transport system permease subunit
MFYLRYLAAELGRRRGRTVLTSLGLAVGVGLVVIVGALSKGLDEAQAKVLEPLTGVGTDLSVSRPIAVGGDGGSGSGGNPFGQLSPQEQRKLQRENKEHNEQFNFGKLGEPGERFSSDSFLSTDLSFPTSEVAKIRELDGAEDAAASLSLNAVHVEGRVPESGAPALGAGAHASGGGFGAEGGFEVETLTVSGVDVRKPRLAMVTPDQVRSGRYFSDSPRRVRREAIVDLAFARQKNMSVGDETRVAGTEFEVVGLAGTPLGGDSANVYVELGRLQQLSNREGRVNEIRVRADSADRVDGLAKKVAAQLDGAEVVTAAELADRVGGSLADADNLSSKLGTALAIVALLAAFLIATLLTLSSVQKRTRELGTLKALGWRQRLVVRQVTGESLVQGALGGLLGAGIGIACAAAVDALGPTLEASVQAQSSGFGPFGQGSVNAGSTDVVLGAPLDVGLLGLAIGLALVGGLLAGIAGGLRAARLRPAEALRSAE